MKSLSPFRRLLLSILLATVSTGAGSLVALEIPLTMSETEGYTRRAENVSVGVPLPRGAVTDLGRLAVIGPAGAPVAAQFERLAVWPDSSVKWVLVDFSADCPAGGGAGYLLNDSGRRPEAASPLKVSEDGSAVTVQTGVLKVVLNREKFDLFARVWLDHNRDGVFADDEQVSRNDPPAGASLERTSGLMALAENGKVESFEVETAGPVRATVAVKGALGDRDREGVFDYTARLHFHAGSGLVRVFFTLENKRHARPAPGMHWVLGRPGNETFKDMSLAAGLLFDGPIQMSVGDGSRDILDRVVLTGEGGIYQESSGGENWFNRVHMNAEYRIPMRFRGARAFLDGVDAYSVDRPDAWLHVADRRYGLAVAVRHFWQNFPKALTATPSGDVRIALWPREYPSLHELQAGEIKTHETAFFFHAGPQGSNRNENRVATVMGAFHHPLVVRAPAEHYLSSGFFDDVLPHDPRAFPDFERLQQAAVFEETNLLTDRDKADEYGWRNFGDTWADNEADRTGGPHQGRDVVSHFNLEYDFGYGMLLQSLRTLGSAPELSGRWWELAETALKHEADIDVFHSMDDPLNRGVYNGGKFTHTAHGVEAALSTHRGSPRLTWFGSLRWPWGQGSSPESGHFNNRGQKAYYYLSGDRRVLESAMHQATLVYKKISEDKFAQIENLSREAGHNLQIMTDAYLLTWDDKYRVAAEKILDSTAPEKQWYMSEQGRREKPGDEVAGYWTSAICINAAARWTAVMEEKLGAPYRKGRDYVTAYADFTSTYLAGGPERGFFSSWTPSGGGRGNLGPWTYRMTDLVMFGHKYSDDPALKRRCLKAAADGFEFMRRGTVSGAPLYSSGKNATMIIGGGHPYTYFRKHGRW